MSVQYVPETGFCVFNRLKAACVLAILVVVIVLGLILGVAAPRYNAPKRGGIGDGQLYSRILDDVAAGESYHVAAVREQRHWGYTVTPIWTVREPTLALFLARLPEPLRPVPLWALGLGVMGGWCWRVQRVFGSPVLTALTFTTLFFATMFAFTQKAYLFHECWAGLLVALSLGLHDTKRWGYSVVIGLVAVLVRELALPYLVVMALCGFYEKRWREGLCWCTALILFAGFMLWHAHAVGQLLLPGDRASGGWVGLGGWPYVLLLARWNGLFIASAPAVVASVLPLMLLGAWAWPKMGGRLALITIGYVTGFMVVGRPDTSYWGLMMTPLWALGVVVVPGALRDLVKILRGAGRSGMPGVV